MQCDYCLHGKHYLTTARIMLAIVATLLVASSAYAQNAAANARSFPPGRRGALYPANPGLTPLRNPSLPTGQVGALKRLAKPNVVMQPIQWKLPEGVTASVALADGFTKSPENLFSLQVGSAYRFKIEGIATYPGQALYPTLELIDRLHPPQGKEWDFPIEIEVPLHDLALALRGAYVTRIVYVENPQNALSVDASESNENLVFDVPLGLDPITAAQTRGRALAILRIGGREPQTAPNANDPFYFGLPRVDFRPATALEPEEVATSGAQGSLQPIPNADQAAAETN